MGGNVLAGVDGKLTLAELAERTQEHSPRSGETIQAAGLVVQVRKVRRNRLAEAVAWVVDGSGTPQVRWPNQSVDHYGSPGADAG
jgi:hypothetical protein